jgi:hypothetical protein
VRKFKRLLPIFLVSVLLAGVVIARPAGAISSSSNQSVTVSKSFRPSYDNPRLYFGTVVRDTADDQGFEPGRRQVPPEASPWTSFFSWSWLSLLISR